MVFSRMGLNGSDHPWSEEISVFVRELGCLDSITNFFMMTTPLCSPMPSG